MNSFQTNLCRMAAGLSGGIILALGLCGCNSDDWDYTPPPGMGSIIVDNRTTDDIDVYLNGYYTNRVSDFDHEVFDLTPGVHHVVLDEAHGSRAWWDDVDVLEGKLTVLEVKTGFDTSDYDVRIYFD